MSISISPDSKTYRQYFQFLIGQMISLVGSSIVNFTVIWWITITTESAFIVSISYAISFLPQILLMPITGVLADCWDRKKTIIYADTLQAITTLIIIGGFFVNFTTVWVIIFANTIRSVGQAFHTPAIQAIIPSMVPAEKISKINSIRILSGGLINIISPAIAVGLIIVFPIHNILWIDVFTFVIALLLSVKIHIPSINHVNNKQQRNFFSKFLKGFQAIQKGPGLIILVIWSVLINFLITPVNVLLPYFVKVENVGTEQHYALLMIATQLGMFGAGCIGIVHNFKYNLSKNIIISSFGMFVGLFFLIFAPSGHYWLMGIGMLVHGLSISLATSFYYSILHLAVPSHIQGRVFSLDYTISMIISPLSATLAGKFSEMIGVYNIFSIIAISGLIVSASPFFTKIMDIDFLKIHYNTQTELVENVSHS